MSNVPPGATPFPAVSAGSVVVDRYRMEQPVSTDLTDTAVWQARDTVLDRPVRVVFLGGSRAGVALDAARRAALVSDPRLSRVLDVGATQIDGTQAGYVVTEPFIGSTLTEIVSSGLVDAQQARAVVGEAAEALAVAAQRGVHHLALRPDAVRVDGHQVIVTGLGIDAGLAGVDGAGIDGAASDARDLAALAYYALTARWAGDSLDEPWLADDVVRPLPAQLDESGVPVPLTSLVPHVDPVLEGVVRRALGHDGDGPANPAEVAEALRPWGEVSVVAALPGFVQPPAGGPPVRQSVRPTTAAAPTMPGAPVRRPTGRIARAASIPAAGTGAVPPPPPAAPAPAYPPAGSYPPAAPPQQTPSPWGPAYAQQGYAPAAYPGAEGGGAAFATEAAPRRRRGVNPTPIVMGLLLVGVVLAAGWAITNALRPLDSAAEPTVTISSSAPAATQGDNEGTDDETAQPEPTPEVRPVIEGAAQVGPAMACKGEQPEQAPFTVDGDPSTFWFTCSYNDPTFGGIKEGVGIAVTLRDPAPVNSVSVMTNSQGGNVQVRKTTVDRPTEGPVLAEGPIGPTTELVFAQPEVGDSFVIWVTELPQSAGRNRLELTEITLQ